MLRLNPDGTNPTDNPFFNGSATNAQGAIWALGLRNPYTFAFNPGTGTMFINDVGESAWEEINRGERGVPTTAGPAAPRRCGKGSSRRRRRGRTTATR